MLRAQTPVQSSSSSPSKHVAKSASAEDSLLDAGSVSAGVYRNTAFGFTCRIPAGWVLRTGEMDVRDKEAGDAADKSADPREAGSRPAQEKNRATLDRTAEGSCPPTGGCGRVLLAAFSRPPEVRAEDVNASILIAVESAAAYPGLKAAAQYFGPVGEIARARGFEVVEEPYEFAIGTRNVVRGDFQKNVGSRVMRQSTLVVLARGYAVSFTFIGGTEDEVEELVQTLSFVTAAKTAH